MAELTTTRGPWTFRWSGGRLADVYHAEYEHAVSIVQVGEYSFGWSRDELERRRAGVGQAELEAAADEWIEGESADWARELPYLGGRS